MADAYYTTDESHYNECLEKGTIVPTKDLKCQRLFRPKISKVKTSFVFEIR